MTSHERANEVANLVRRLGSRRQSLVDAARARLAIIGARAVDALVESLDHDDNRIRAHAMPLLALIQDGRGVAPLLAMVLDRDPKMREIAARCLGRFPSADTVCALERLLARERRAEVRAAMVRALVEQYAAGEEQAIRQPLALMTDQTADRRVRLASLGLLPLLKPAERRSLLRRLRQDPSREVARKARILEEQSDAERDANGSRTRQALADLAAKDYARWYEAVHRLAGHGSAVIEPLVAEMQRRAHDPEYCARAGMVLKALGPRRGRALEDALDRIQEPLPLQVLVEVVGALGEKSLIYRLKDLIERLAKRAASAEEANGFDPLQRVRAKAHLELARIGSRVAIQDLRDALADADRGVEIEILAAVELIGKREEIAYLLRAYPREDRFARERIARVVRSIMRRERIRRNDPMFHAFGSNSRRSIEAILPRSSRARSRSRVASLE